MNSTLPTMTPRSADVAALQDARISWKRAIGGPRAASYASEPGSTTEDEVALLVRRRQAPSRELNFARAERRRPQRPGRSPAVGRAVPPHEARTISGGILIHTYDRDRRRDTVGGRGARGGPEEAEGVTYFVV